MKKYPNRSGVSGVRGYETGKDYIRVWFQYALKPYVYNYEKPGKEKVERMKKLAASGEGLSTFISRYVKDEYYE
ncbi:MAG TPA: hypothetical protein VNB90_02005 [Cytophagaceae bacterium]|jgi:hypothetical protein|nr:hypothetical protein [Cytophagaceae bacterium]